MATLINRSFSLRQYDFTVPVWTVYALTYGTGEDYSLTEKEVKAINAFTDKLDELVTKHHGTHYTIELPDDTDTAKEFRWGNDITGNIGDDVVTATVHIFNDTENAFNNIRKYIDTNAPKRSAWDKGVIKYAHELAEELQEYIAYEHELINNLTSANLTEQTMLNGARNWLHYSESGCSLAYNVQIAKRLCTPSQLKKNLNGAYNPSKDETWLQVQARALKQAADLVLNAVKAVAI